MKSAGEKNTTSAQVQRKSGGADFFGRRGGDHFFSPTVQTKTEVSQPGDSFEQEADQMAEQVVQRQANKETPASRDQVQTPRRKLLQRKEEDGKGPSVPPKVDESLSQSKGAGSPLPEPVRQEMESGFGADFGDVRVHTDSRATQMSQALNAHAFAHGQDIYFNEGKFNPETQSGRQLLAHELTHTVQQNGAIQQKRIQRVPNASPPTPTAAGASAATGGNPNKFESTTEKGTVEKKGSKYKLTIPTIKVPLVKAPYMLAPLSFTLKDRGETKQRETWDTAMAQTGGIDQKIKNKITQKGAKSLLGGKATPVTYGLKLEKNNSMVLGTIPNLKGRIMRPYWDPEGAYRTYDVDHKREIQVGGKDELSNLWLLDSRANRSSGSALNVEKNTKIQSLITEASGPNPEQLWTKQTKPDDNAIFKSGNFDVEFTQVRDDLTIVGDATKIYERNDIQTALKPMDGMRPMTDEEIKETGLNDANTIVLFSNPTGGRSYKFTNWDKDNPTRQVNIPLGRNAKIQSITFKEGEGGSIQLELFQQQGQIPPGVKQIPIRPMDGLPTAGFIPRGNELIKQLPGFSFALFSPIEFIDAEIMPGKGLVARAAILPDLPFLNQGSSLDLVIDGSDISLEKTFVAGEFKLPAPFQINGCTLTVSIGTRGMRAEGNVLFGIDRVGEGSIGGFIGSDGKFGLRGEFTFDRKLFDNANVSITYEKGELTVQGTINIPPNKVRGIKKATAMVNYRGGVLTASGNADLDVKGVQKGTMNLRYQNEELTVGGDFQLSNEIPRLRSGSVAATVTKKGEDYEVSASGKAQLDIPGVDTAIDVSYQNGALLVQGSVTYERGIAKGTIQAGATNRAVGADGNPSGPPGDKWTIYGGGSLTLRITPWLQATAGVRFNPAGDMEVSGTIGIPNVVNVFDRKQIDRRLFDFPTLEIPLFAVPLGPRSIGLVATIGGGIDFNAGFGPGQLQELSATITYKPGQEDSIQVGGRGKFVIPADASIRLFGRAGIGISAGIGRVTGGIEVGAAVGINGKAEAEVMLNWSPGKGITLDAVGRIYVEPALRFDLGLVFEASALGLSYEKHKKLAQKEFGSGLRYGLEFPAHYQEGQAFDVPWDKVKVIRPEVDIGEVVRRFGRELWDS